MIRQVIHLNRWRWDIIVYYGAGVDDADEILDSLARFGCSEGALSLAGDNLFSGDLDTGLTYTNPRVRTTVMVIGKWSSPEEFWDTLDHEKGHAARHIGDALFIDIDGEEQQYLAGEIAKKMYRIARHFICGC